MQDWVAASDLVSYLEHTGYKNNAPFVYVRVQRGALATLLKSNQPLKKSDFKEETQILLDHTSTFLRPQVT